MSLEVPGERRRPAGAWRVVTSTDAPGWLEMPDTGDASADEAWLAEREAGARRAFGDRWTERHDELVPVLLRAGLDRREPGDLIAWQVWPLALPLSATVQVRVVPSGAADLLAQGEGSTVQPYSSPGLGEGVQVHATTRHDAAPELLVATTAFVFDDGDAAVVITVAPTPLELLAFASPGVRDIVDRMALTRPDGTGFRGIGSDRFIDAEAWSAA